jgi:hypothetical protein
MALEVCATAIELAGIEALPIVLVLEKPYGGNATTIAGIGAMRGRWIDAWESAGGKRTRVVSVATVTYRTRVFGGAASRWKRELARAREVAYARTVANTDAGNDQAAAICIGTWAARAAEVAKKLPKRSTKTARTAGKRYEQPTLPIRA